MYIMRCAALSLAFARTVIDGKWFLALALFICLPALLHAATARNPLSPIEAAGADDRSPGVQTESAPDGGPTLASIHGGDFAVYQHFDFDSGVAAFKAHAASPRGGGTVEVRLDRADGKLLGRCAIDATGGWDTWRDFTCNVDNTQSGVRDVFLVFHGPSDGKALFNLQSFVFLKSTVQSAADCPDLAARVDRPDDGEPQGIRVWGMPETGFTDDFADGHMSRWTGHGLRVVDGRAVAAADEPAFAFTPDVYINKTDIGGDWRAIAEGAFSATVTADSTAARPGLGFASRDGKQGIYVVLDPEHGALEAWRQLADGSRTLIRRHPKLPTDQLPGTDLPGTWTITPGRTYRLQLDWSPFSNALLVFLYDDTGAEVTNFRTVIDLPVARRPLLVCEGGPARFGAVKFDPTLDGGNFRWEWKKEPVLQADVCNPAVWRGPDGKMYMMWRKFGADNFHGVATSDDGVRWTRVTDQAIKCTGDMNVLADPLGDGKWYATPGGNGMPWWSSDGRDQFKTWTQTPLNLGDIFGNSRVQEIIDTKHRADGRPVSLGGQDYRFIAYTEDWNRAPKPHTVVLLSNTLTRWVQTDPDPVLPPHADFWGEKGSAIGSAFALPGGDLLLACCACTNEGYTGAPEPSNVSAIADGREPWKLRRVAVLPDAPVSRENVWYQGPNFGTAYFYDEKSDTLFFYGGFHDYYVGTMRVRNFRQQTPPASAR